jgi:hypothetical protein
MKNFLPNATLYQREKILENFSTENQNYLSPYDFIGETFEYKCDIEDSYKTFELELDLADAEFYNPIHGNELPNSRILNDNLNYTFKIIGKCKSCNKYKIFFMLNVFSEIDIEIQNKKKASYKFLDFNLNKLLESDIYVQKVGVFPKIQIKPSKEITKYFNTEINSFYYKGLNSLHQNFGIGAFAYFRRIIEKELLNIISDIKSLPDSHTTEIERLLLEHDKTPNISTIYDNIFEHLPNSLKSLGNNPIKLLYNQTSEGLHSLSEEDCLKRANTILKLLEFVIKKINEEKSEIKNLRNMLKDLK